MHSKLRGEDKYTYLYRHWQTQFNCYCYCNTHPTLQYIFFHSLITEVPIFKEWKIQY